MHKYLLRRISGMTNKFSRYRSWVSQVRAQTGKGVLRQAREILRLRRAGGQCGVADYYLYKLYDEQFQQGRGAADFIGWRLQQQFTLALNPRSAVLPGWDKIVFSLVAESAGLPIAPIRACYHRAEKMSAVLGQHLKSREAVGEFLRDEAVFPLFGKPAFSQQGYGAAYLAGYDRASDCLRLLNGESISVDAFLERLERSVDQRFHKPECGYLFQRPLVSAPEIYALTNWTALCGVRIVCLNGPEGVRPISASWKIAVPPNQVDNFSMGKYGNLSAQIDLESGEIGRVINAFWPQAKVLERHPITGLPLKGLRLPGWDRLLAICRAAGAVFPLMKIHHWDFALTDQGPMILELNDLGGIDIDQAYGSGFLTRETREFLLRYGDRQAYPWIARL